MKLNLAPVALALLPCPFTLADTPTTVADLFANDGFLGNQLGESVGLGDNLAVVGAPLDGQLGSSAGAAYVFDALTGAQLHKLLASDGGAGDALGFGVAVSGPLALVGAKGSGPLHNGFGIGATYAFDLNTGQELLKLVPSDGGTTDLFGHSVALDGNIALVGAPQNDVTGTDMGAAYLFDLTTGQELHKLVADDGQNHDQFGYSVAIQGNLAVAGAFGDDDLGFESGSAYVFDVSTGQQIVKLLGADITTADSFGVSVAIDGNNVLVGASTHNHGFSQSGSAFLFDAQSGVQLAEYLPECPQSGSGLGSGVDLEGSLVAIGSSGATGFLGQTQVPSAGAVHLFDLVSGQETSVVFAPNPTDSARFGTSVAVDGSLIAGGSPGNLFGPVVTGEAVIIDASAPSASATTRNGSGLNANLLTSLSDPIVGSNWNADLDASGHASSLASILIYSTPFSGLFLTGGEVLIDVSSPQTASQATTHQGASTSFSFAIPADPSLCGLTASAQGLVLGAPGYALSNAIDLVLGL